jgi:HPt (histidine-containing phosphotransfer) domain-containing protein
MEFKAFDTSNLFLISGNDPDFVIELLQMFAATLSNEVTAVKASFDLKDWTNLQFIVHRLRSSSGSVGAENILLTCREIETYIKAGAIEEQELNGLVEKFFSSCEFDLSEIKKELTKLEQNSFDLPD